MFHFPHKHPHPMQRNVKKQYIKKRAIVGVNGFSSIFSDFHFPSRVSSYLKMWNTDNSLGSFFLFLFPLIFVSSFPFPHCSVSFFLVTFPKQDDQITEQGQLWKQLMDVFFWLFPIRGHRWSSFFSDLIDHTKSEIIIGRRFASGLKGKQVD